MAVLVIRLHFLDASALVKLVIDEPGSSELCSYFHRDATAFTTNTVCVGFTFRCEGVDIGFSMVD